jgi:hypothetical protein
VFWRGFEPPLRPVAIRVRIVKGAVAVDGPRVAAYVRTGGEVEAAELDAALGHYAQEDLSGGGVVTQRFFDAGLVERHVRAFGPRDRGFARDILSRIQRGADLREDSG